MEELGGRDGGRQEGKEGGKERGREEGREVVGRKEGYFSQLSTYNPYLGLNSTTYAVKGLPPLSVLSAHRTKMEVGPVAVASNRVGEEGGTTERRRRM